MRTPVEHSWHEAQLSNVPICTPARKYADRVREPHIKVLHILIELVERHFFPQNYVNVNVNVA